MKNAGKWLLMSAMSIFNLGNGWAQTYTVAITKKLNTFEAASWSSRHDTRFGLAVSTSSDWAGRQVSLEVNTTQNIQLQRLYECNESIPILFDQPILIYAASTNSNNTDVARDGVVARERFIDWGFFTHWNLSCDLYFPYSYIYYGKMALAANDALNNYSPASINPFNKRHIEVNIKLTLPFDISLSEVTKIKIPGVAELTGLDFIKNQLPPTHACADPTNTSQHCKVVKAVDSKQLPTGDVFVAAHRGLWGDQAETSIGAVLAAESSGWNLIEVDILKTKDNILLLMHDQQINRLSEVGLSPDPTREYPKGPDENTSNKTWLSQLNYNAPTADVPTMSGGTRVIPALKDLRLVNKWGELVAGTDLSLVNFRDAEELFSRLTNWDVVIALDIKDKDQNDYLFVTEQLLRLGIKHGVLDKLMFKPGSGVAGLEYQLFADYLFGKTETKDNVTVNLLDAFRNNVTVALILYANLFDTITPQKDFESYMTPWLSMPSLSVVETQYKTGSDFFLVPSVKLENKTPVQWLKDLDFRTGTFWDNAIDCRGTSDGRGHWFIPDENSNSNYDFRGDLEWVINQQPGLIVTDRPDATADYLNLFNLNAPLNKKQ
jgi:glycerophosphoryl diester phosphodiesterase